MFEEFEQTELTGDNARLYWLGVIYDELAGEISAATTNGRAVWDAMLPTATYEFANNANVMAIWWRARP